MVYVLPGQQLFENRLQKVYAMRGWHQLSDAFFNDNFGRTKKTKLDYVSIESFMPCLQRPDMNSTNKLKLVTKMKRHNDCDDVMRTMPKQVLKVFVICYA